jgi:hypothetical protein
LTSLSIRMDYRLVGELYIVCVITHDENWSIYK